MVIVNMACNIIYKWKEAVPVEDQNGKKKVEYIEKSRTFKSNRELDEYLWKIRSVILKNETTGQIFYNESPQDITLATIHTLEDEAKNALDNIKSAEDTASVGLTSVFKVVGNSSAMENSAEHQVVSKNNTNASTISSEDIRDLHQSFGNRFHERAESIAKGQTPKPIKMKYYNSDATYEVPTAETSIDEAFNALIKKHRIGGVDPKICSETVLMSKNVYPKFMQFIVDRLKNDATISKGTLNGSSQVNGRSDLILVDANGDAWVYDFKTTAYDIREASEWNMANELRLASYMAILRQHGVNVKGGGFVHIPVTWTAEKTKVDHVSFNKNGGIIMLHAGNPNLRAANLYFPCPMGNNPIATLNGVTDIMTKLVPDTSILTQRELAKKTVEDLESSIVPISENSNKNLKMWNPSAQFYYYMPSGQIPDSIKKSGWTYGNYLLGKSKEELKERLTKYCEALVEMGDTIIPAFAKTIQDAIQTKDLSEFSDALHALAPYHYTTLYHHLVKYVDGTWSLIYNEELIQNGIFIFQKVGTNRLEIVAMDTHRLDRKLTFKTTNGNDDPYRTSMLGAFLPDSKVDPRFFMEGTLGNAVLLKIAAYISLNPDTFGSNSIAHIKALSTCDKHVAEVSNEELESTWTRICVEANKKYNTDWKLIQKGILMDACHAGIVSAVDVMSQSQNQALNKLLHWTAFSTIRPDGNYSIEDLQKRLQLIRTQFPDNTPERQVAENEIDQVLHYLQTAVLTYYGYFPKSERNVGPYFNRSLGIDGINASSMQESKSVNLRQLQELISNFFDVYKQKFEKKVVLWQNAFEEFKKETGQSYVIADDFKYFRENWFLKDENGKLDHSMKLKAPSNEYWRTVGPKELKLYEMYCEMWAEYRYGNDTNALKMAKMDGSFYEIPLIRTNFKKQCEAGGLWNSIKGWVKRTRKDIRGSLFGLEDDLFEEQERLKINDIKLPSYIQDLVGTKRMEAIEKNGTSYYETNMDIVYMTALAVSLRREMSEHAMMLITALRSNIYWEHFINNNTMTDIFNAADKTVTSKMYGRSVINPKNRGIMMLISFVKSVTSFTTLTWNFKSFASEITKGITDGFSRTAWDPEYLKKMSPRDYMDALEEVATSCHENISNTSFMMQLSHYFGMANFSGDQIVRASQTNPWGAYEVGSDAMYITATWPDFCHRTAFLVAHLKHEGIWDAYGLDEKGVLKYDMTKDKRFQMFLKYKDNPEAVNKLSREEQLKYSEERDLYKELLDDFARADKKSDDNKVVKYGDLLPDGLSPRTQNNLKVLADKLYGNYDNETKSLMQQELLGSLFFQFRTYPLERLSQWFKSETHINDIEYEQIYDEKTGEKIYIYLNDDGKSYTIKKESEIDGKDIVSGRAKAYKVANGTPVEGHMQRMIGALTYLFKHDQYELNEKWKNDPNFKSQLGLALYDMFFGVILAFLVKLMFGEDRIQNMDEEEWYSRWLYAVGTGMTQDGPVWSLLSGIVGDGAPPSVSILQSYASNAMAVIHGNASLPYAIVNTFGATKYFNLVDE